MKNRGIGLGKVLIVFVVGCLILVFLVNPQITDDISDFFENPGGAFGDPPEIDFGELSETYEDDYIHKYLWNNYENQEIKISGVSEGLWGNGIVATSGLPEGVDYRFSSTCDLVKRETTVYLIDNENVISECESKYTSCEFTVIGTLTKKEVDFGSPLWGHDYENVVVIEATEIKVHHS